MILSVVVQPVCASPRLPRLRLFGWPLRVIDQPQILHVLDPFSIRVIPLLFEVVYLLGDTYLFHWNFWCPGGIERLSGERPQIILHLFNPVSCAPYGISFDPLTFGSESLQHRPKGF